MSILIVWWIKYRRLVFTHVLFRQHSSWERALLVHVQYHTAIHRHRLLWPPQPTGWMNNYIHNTNFVVKILWSIWQWCVCVCMHVSVCAHVRVCVCVHVHACAWPLSSLLQKIVHNIQIPVLHPVVTVRLLLVWSHSLLSWWCHQD